MTDWLSLTRAQVEHALAAFREAGKTLDYSRLANCRPDLDLARAIWHRDDLEVTDVTRWPEGWTVSPPWVGFVDPAGQPEGMFPSGTRVFYIPAIETWFAACVSGEGVSLLTREGFLSGRELCAMYLHPHAVSHPDSITAPAPAQDIDDFFGDLL